MHCTSERDERILIGASWYPEMWPAEEWPRDVARMKEIGFNIVRLFEFAWHRFEPRERAYDFAWARQVLDLLHEAGIVAMLGTPSAAPPAWLTAKYPEVLQVRPDGTRRTHGMRKHGSHVSTWYRELCADIVGKMVEELGDHPAVHSWQIDNEMGGSDFSDGARASFHKWLEARYGSVEKMNETWGLEFWSQAYGHFSQVPMPTARVGSIEVPERHHPSLIMAVARFSNDQWSGYIADQCKVIRAGSDKPITTNMVKGLGMHWYQHNKALDRVGHSLYADVDHYAWQLWCFDRMRAEKPSRPYWLLETAPNWSGGGRLWNIHHDAAGMRAIAWMSVMLGGSMVLFWQWRQHWAGQEMQHGTCVTATGQWRPNKQAWADVAGQFATHGRWLLDHPPAPADVAIMLSNEAAWAFSIDPVDDDMEYAARWRDDYYLPLVRAQIWRDVIHEAADLDRYKLILMPHMPIVAKDTRARLREWVKRGGRLLLGPLTGHRTEEFTCFREQAFGGLEELMGATSSVRFTPMWVEDRIRMVFEDGHVSPVKSWCEGFAPTTGRALARYESPATGDGRPAGYGDGEVAAVYNAFGDGVVVTLGSRVDEATYLKLVRLLGKSFGLKPMVEGGGDVLVVPRGGAGRVAGYGLVNLKETTQDVVLPVEGVDRLTGERVGSAVSLKALQVMLVEADG